MQHEAGVAVDGCSFTPWVAEVQNAVPARVLEAFQKKRTAARVTQFVNEGVPFRVGKKREKLRVVLDELGSFILRERPRTPLEDGPGQRQVGGDHLLGHGTNGHDALPHEAPHEAPRHAKG